MGMRPYGELCALPKMKQMSGLILSLYKMWKDQNILLITNPVLAISSRAQVLHICVFSTTKSSTTKMTYSFCLNWALHLTTPNSEKLKMTHTTM